MPGVITGQQLKEIRRRARLSNKQLADLFQVSLSTVNRMLANGVRAEDEPTVRERLAPWLPQIEPDRYTSMSDGAILAEMNRMLGIIGQRLAKEHARYEELEREYHRLVEQIRESTGGDAGFTTYPQDDPPADAEDDINSVPDEPTAGWGTGPASL